MAEPAKHCGADPRFFTTDPAMLPTFSQLQALSTASPTIYQIDPNLRAPYTIQEAASIERQVTKAATVSLTYLNSRGEHALFIRNINAPLNGVYPLPRRSMGRTTCISTIPKAFSARTS